MGQQRVVSRPLMFDLVVKHADPVITAGEIQDILVEEHDIDTTKVTILNRLGELVDEGKLQRCDTKQLQIYYPTTRFDVLAPDLEERVHKYADEEGLSHKAATQELFRKGLDAVSDEYQLKEKPGTPEKIANSATEIMKLSVFFILLALWIAVADQTLPVISANDLLLFGFIILIVSAIVELLAWSYQKIPNIRVRMAQLSDRL